MERRPFRGPGLISGNTSDTVDDARPELGRLLEQLGVAVPLRHAVSSIVPGVASPIQAAALADAVRGEDLLAVAPTGSGKTLVFAVGIAHRIGGSPSVPGRPRALVVSPTRELALQTDEVLAVVGAGAGLRTTTFVGGQPLARDKRSLVAPVDIAVGTPGRLTDLMRSGTLGSGDIQIIVLDEVDQLLDPSFRDQTLALLERCPQAALMSTTATANAAVEDELRRRRPDLRLHRVAPVAHGTTPATSTGAGPAAPTNSPRHLLVLTTNDPEVCATALAARCRRALFFVPRRDAVDPLRSSIAATGVTTSGVSGSASPTQRASAFAELAAGKVRVLVSTDLAGRGLDLRDIGHIIHVGLPHSLEDLVHRSGRTGRGDSAAGTVAAVIRPGDIARMLEQATKAGMTVEQLDADAPVSRARIEKLLGPEIALSRTRRTPAPRDATRRPARSRVHRPKKKRK